MRFQGHFTNRDAPERRMPSALFKCVHRGCRSGDLLYTRSSFCASRPRRRRIRSECGLGSMRVCVEESVRTVKVESVIFLFIYFAWLHIVCCYNTL